MNDQFDYSQPVEYNTEGFTPTEQPKQKNGYATAALTLGIIALVISCCCFCCFMIIPVLSVIAIVLAVLSKNKTENGVMPGKAKAGMILAIIALVLFVIYIAVYGVAMSNPDIYSELFDPMFEDVYGMSFEEYVEYVENMGEYDTLPVPKTEVPVE